jgi:hypothetical protein
MAGGWDRQEIYAQCLAELEARIPERGLAAAGTAATGVRQRGGRLEPRLDPQLRRGSRRTDRQRLAEEAEGDLSPPSPAG